MNADRVRALLNDQAAHIFDDAALEPFLNLASQNVPYIAAALVAYSRGLDKMAENMLSFVPAGIVALTMRKEERAVINAAENLAKVGEAVGAGELPSDLLHKLYDAVREYQK